MVKVANDVPAVDRDLPAATSTAALDSGITVADVARLPAARDGRLHATEGRLDTVIVRSRQVRRAATDPSGTRDRLVLADAAQLDALLDSDPGTVRGLAGAGAAALVVGGAGAGLGKRLVDQCTELELPLLLLPHGRLDQLNSEVLGAVLDHQDRILGRLDSLHQALVDVVLAGGSLHEVCAQVVGFIGGAVMVTTTDGRVLSMAGPTEEVSWSQGLDCFDRTGRLITEEEPIGPRSQEGVAAHRCAVRIVAGSTDHGLLVAFSRERMLGADDVRLLERASTVAALAIAKEQAVSAVESKYRAEFLRDALAGRAGSPAEAIAHAASLGWDIDRPLVVVVAEMDEDEEQIHRDADEVRFLQERFAKAWTHAVGIRDGGSPVMGFSREVVTVLGVSEPDDVDRVMRVVSDLVRVVRGDGGGGRRSFSAGVSRVAHTVAELPRAYDEALNAVTVGRQMHGYGALTHVDGLGIYRLLALVPDSAQLRRFVHDALGELATDDSPEAADLRQTLAILIDTNMNVAETARQLFFHYNTLRYRITKLERMLGPFTTDPELRLTLALALKVHQMKGI